MESAASFSLLKSKKAYFVNIQNLRNDGDDILFLCDSGASMSLIGLNTICGENEDDCKILKSILEKEIQKNGIKKHDGNPKTVTRETLAVYPCKIDGVSVSGAAPSTLYFHIFLGHINLPLLGFDYIDDCSFRHGIGGNIDVTAIATNAGRRFYPDIVIDFNRVLDTYRNSLK